MDSLIEAALNAAALRANCRSHPERVGVASIYDHTFERAWLCKECADAFPWPVERAWGCGIGPDAAREQEESKRYDKEYQDSKTNAKVMKYYDN